MKSFFSNKELKYDGTQLSSHFSYKNFAVAGNSIVSFIGPVEVRLTEMVDIEDVIHKEPIASDKMLSFIIETFDLNLAGAVWMQRLFMNIIKDEMNGRLENLSIRRDGDDLFFEGRKLSVSIATVSPVSAMVHTALNIVRTGAPIPVSCLEEMGINPSELAEKVMADFCREFDEVEFARIKVNWVK